MTYYNVYCLHFLYSSRVSHMLSMLSSMILFRNNMAEFPGIFDAHRRFDRIINLIGTFVYIFTIKGKTRRARIVYMGMVCFCYCCRMIKQCWSFWQFLCNSYKVKILHHKFSQNPGKNKDDKGTTNKPINNHLSSVVVVSITTIFLAEGFPTYILPA